MTLARDPKQYVIIDSWLWRHLGDIWEASGRHLGGIHRRFSPLAKEFPRLILERIFNEFHRFWMAVGLHFDPLGSLLVLWEDPWNHSGAPWGPDFKNHQQKSLFRTSF